MTKLLILLFLLSNIGCNPMGKPGLKVAWKNPAAFKDLKTQVSNVSVVNNQLVITGSTLSAIKTATLKNGTQEEIFQVESATDSQIIANGSKAISILAGSIFDLILTDAYGAATFQVTFAVTDGSITAAKLNSMGASAGQYLKYNGTTWVPSSVLDGQTYMGTWDASTTILPALSSPGDYWIVSVAGTFGTPAVTYSAGDWIITDGYNWQKVGYSKTVSSFQGRKGIVTLQPSDYVSLKTGTPAKITGSSINDLADVDLTTIAPTIDGQVLKWSSGTNKWMVGTDATGVALTALSASAPIVYNSSTGAFSISVATTSAAGTLSATDKTKLDTLAAFPAGDGLTERFSGILAAKTCASGEILVWYSPTGWTCSTSFIMSRNTTANTAGNDLNLQASGATTLATDKSGGNLVLSGGTSTGTGTSSIQFKTASSGATGTADNTSTTKMTILGNGNVGIGTTNPTEKLQVVGRIRQDAPSGLAGFIQVNGANLASMTAINPGIDVFHDSANIYGFNLGYTGRYNVQAVFPSHADYVMATHTSGVLPTQQSDFTPRLTVRGDTGNVGIGTTAPAEKLSIIDSNGTPGQNVFSAQNTNGSGAGQFSIKNNGTGQLIMQASGSAYAGIPSLYNKGAVAIAGNLSALAFVTNSDLTTGGAAPITFTSGGYNNGPTMTVSAGNPGNVGVGTTTPQAKLQIANGDIALDSAHALYSYGQGSFGTANGLWGNFYNDGSLTQFLTSGIGTYASTIGDIRFSKYNGTVVTPMMTIQASSGNVGIGTTAPTAKLEVAGPIISQPYTVSNIITTLDLSKSNTFTIATASGSNYVLSNMVNGGDYTVVITDTTSQTYTFACTGVTKYKPANSATTSGTSTIYSILTIKNGSNYDCYITWASGYQ